MVAARPVIDQEYLRAFHRQRPGITQAVLDQARDAGITPYQWLAKAVPATGRTLDLACGSAPVRPALPSGHRYLGADRSPQELAEALTRGASALVRADAAALPLADGSLDTVVCSMALMILQPLDQVLAEIRRVLRPGGTLAALVPTDAGSDTRAARLLGRTLLGTRRLPQCPNTPALRRPAGLLAAHGLRLLADETRRFAYPLRDRAAADLLLDSLYLPGLTDAAQRRARHFAHAAAALRVSAPIPIRRLLARAE